MNGNDYQDGRFELYVGRILGANPPVTNATAIDTQPLTVDAIPADYHALKKSMRIAHPYGLLRLPRRGQSVLISHVAGSSQLPVGFLHTFNLEQDATCADAMPTVSPGGALLLENIDDLVIYHDETYAFTRFRNSQSTATTAGPMGAPAYVELLRTLSGFEMLLEEYPPDVATTPPAAPNPPTRAKFTITMPQMAKLTLDEPSSGESTLTYEHPSGMSLVIANDGTVTLTSPTKIVVDAPDVECGSDGGMVLAYKSDVDALQEALSTHMHSNVASGGGVSGPPVAPLPTAVGTTRTHAT